MTLAQEQGDHEAWFDAFGQTLRMGRQVSQDPNMISALVGIAIQALAVDAAHRYIAGYAGPVPDETLAEIARAVQSHALPGLDRTLRGEQIMARDTLEYVYDTGVAGMEVVRDPGGRPAPRPATPAFGDDEAIGPGMPSRTEHREIFEAYYTGLREWARLPASERGTSALARGLERDREASLLLGILAPGLEKSARAWDQFRAERAGLLTVCAIERFRLARGGYPRSLDDLDDTGLLAEPALDPYTGGLLGYRPPAQGPYAGGRAYVVYAAGADGRDNGGKVDFEDPVRAVTVDGHMDLLLNRHARRGDGAK